MTSVKKGGTIKINPPMIIAAALIVLVLIVSVVTVVKSKSNVIFSGVTAGGIDLSGMTIDQAEKALTEKIISTADERIIIKADGDEFSATYRDFGASYDIHKTAEDAFAYGHDGFFSSIIPVLKSVFGGETKIELSVIINDRVFDKTMAENTDYDKSVEASFSLTDSSVEVTNGVGAYTINPVTAKKTLVAMMKNLDFSTLTFEKENIEPIPFDIDIITENYSDEPAAASYARDSLGEIYITPGREKVTVDVKEARDIIKNHTLPGESYSIPAHVELVGPTERELTDALFRDKLSSFSSSYSTSDSNRSTNVALASKSIDNKVLLPGESFSYNDTLGKRTPEAGYKMAGAYANGQSVQQYGGGICQVSSTLYNAVLLANLKINQRTCHMFKVGYVPLGRDATADYGTVDFVFSNDTDYPIKISSHTTSSKQVVCEIIGTKTENFTVTLETTDVVAVPFSTKIVEDPELLEGTEKITERGSDGAKCSLYRIVSVDGKEVSRTFEASSYYMPHNQVVTKGTKKAEPAISDAIESHADSDTIGSPAVSEGIEPRADSEALPEAHNESHTEAGAIPHTNEN